MNGRSEVGFIYSLGGYLVLGAPSGRQKQIYALAKNAILWRFCLRDALTLIA